jgi:hypothetical protein
VSQSDPIVIEACTRLAAEHRSYGESVQKLVGDLVLRLERSRESNTASNQAPPGFEELSDRALEIAVNAHDLGLEMLRLEQLVRQARSAQDARAALQTARHVHQQFNDVKRSWECVERDLVVC